MNRLNADGIFAQFPPKMKNDLIERPRGTSEAVAPQFTEKLFPHRHLPWMRGETAQELNLTHG